MIMERSCYSLHTTSKSLLKYKLQVLIGTVVYITLLVNKVQFEYEESTLWRHLLFFNITCTNSNVFLHSFVSDWLATLSFEVIYTICHLSMIQINIRLQREIWALNYTDHVVFFHWFVQIIKVRLFQKRDDKIILGQ